MSSSFDLNALVRTIRSVVPPEFSKVSLHEPRFAGNEWAYVKECLDTGWVSSVGSYVEKFEAMLAEFTGAKRAVVIVNGTAALHLSLKLVGVEAGDEVLIQAMTFIATANAVSYIGAIPHFVDCDEQSMGLDPVKLDGYLREIAEVCDVPGSQKGGSNKPGMRVCRNKKTGRLIKAVVPMHSFGHPVDLDPLVELCQRWSIPLIEDAAESLGSYYKGRHTGTFGCLGTLSFNGNKVVTTGGGGAIITNDEALGKLAKHLSTTAKVPHRWAFNHDMVGYNYRLPNINSALGCAQLEQLPGFLAQKRILAEKYQKAFASFDGARFFTEPAYGKSNYWLNALLLDEVHAARRDDVLAATNDSGLMTRPAWTLMSKLPMFCDSPKMDLTTAESLERRLINIPSSPFLAGVPNL